MRSLIVFAHADPASLTHAVAARIAEGVVSTDAANVVEMADLSAEGFDPRFSAADLALFRRQAGPPPDVLAEQARIDRADALVLVYPVYWWSMPGQLKGWIDRVFTNGWAYDETPDGGLVKHLGRLRVHLVGIGASDAGTYERRGYANAMRTQIDHGIFDFCGAQVATSEFLLAGGESFPASALDRARAIGHAVAAGAATDEAA
ncbi:NAD(P)H dehydrogenase (quinone) [Methylopila capsulata]|uniref:NAD(P)H dehydrogenase n=1 Tax=Methylopila capsulata TaxID=61654 RepID=A0A9W6ISU4_9HYPH|nr:NAD(P)H-dependent oxidoreductase [Methylopila capsulata]MBM7850260.1 NAD(P)H dehydrogenase (quinone) [Methylopila capsulata]GLK55553.1 NAD(P)H dehydrogenase [Methylopila capsulata]